LHLCRYWRGGGTRILVFATRPDGAMSTTNSPKLGDACSAALGRSRHPVLPSGIATGSRRALISTGGNARGDPEEAAGGSPYARVITAHPSTSAHRVSIRVVRRAHMPAHAAV
jgi:hypothetical protein